MEILADRCFLVTLDTGVDWASETDFPPDCQLAGGFPKCCTEPDVGLPQGFLSLSFFTLFRSQPLLSSIVHYWRGLSAD